MGYVYPNVLSHSKYDHIDNYAVLREDNYDGKASSCVQRSEALRGNFVSIWNKIPIDKAPRGDIISEQ